MRPLNTKSDITATYKMDYSLYIHIPFCSHRCAYCDFNTYAGQEDSIRPYVEALVKEIELVGASVPERLAVRTVFFGGGTPSLLAPSEFKSILDSIRRTYDLSESAEVTMEANPGTVSFDALQELRGLGVNRISFGAQSANGEELRMLERTHSFFDVIQAVSSARRAGFRNLNLDLIYGLPEQTITTWKATVHRILDLEPEHISAYALTLERGTPFGNWSARGLLPIPDPDAAAEMYEWVSETFEAAGYMQYEISNWAKTLGKERRKRKEENPRAATGNVQSDFACRHNLQYWRCLPYLGFGAGAHGYANGVRYSNVLRIKTYIDRFVAAKRDLGIGAVKPSFPLSPATVNQHQQTMQDDMSEFMIMGLRLTQEGISSAAFRARFGHQVSEVYGKEANDLQGLGLIESVDQGNSATLRLTSRGRLLGNQVFLRFV